MLAALRLPRRLPCAPSSLPSRALSTTPSPSATATPRIIQYLGYGGALPFLAGGLSSSLLPDGTSTAQATRLYGAAILSFLGGVHWGLALRHSPVVALDFAYSVTPSLVAWGATLAPLPQGLAVLGTGFAGAWVWDEVRLRRYPDVPAWYRALRRPLSVAAVGGCLVAWRAVRTVGERRWALGEEGEGTGGVEGEGEVGLG